VLLNGGLINKKKVTLYKIIEDIYFDTLPAFAGRVFL